MISAPGLDRFLYLLGGAALFAPVCYCSGSIRVVIGLHGALSLYAFSRDGNWKMGGGLSGTLPAAGTRLAIEVLAFLIASLLMLYFHRRGHRFKSLVDIR